MNQPTHGIDNLPKQTLDIMAVSWWLVGLFGISGAACFATALRGPRLQNGDARRGLRWLLIIVGSWGALQAGVLLADQESTAVLLYTLSLVVGFATVFPWLYFVSAYAGRDYHRQPAYRWAGIIIYAMVTSTKLTNPIHERYFTAEFRTEPFRQLIIDHGILHLGSFVLAYSLSAVGFYILYQLYRDSGQSSWRLVALFAATGLPIAPTLLARVLPITLPELSYEPLGVAVFAVGSVYFVEDSLLAVEQTRRRSLVNRTAGGVITLNTDGTVSEYNERAVELFPSIASGTHIESVSSAVAETYRQGQSSIVDIRKNGTARTYRLTSEPLNMGGEDLGWTLLVQDVTTRQLREQQLEVLNRILRHNLRNTANVIHGRSRILQESLDDDELCPHATMIENRADELATLSKKASTVRSLFQSDPHANMSYDVTKLLTQIVAEFSESNPTASVALGEINAVSVCADSRLEVAITELLDNAIVHNDSSAPEVTVSVGPADQNEAEDWVEIEITDNGPGIPVHEQEVIERSEETSLQHGSGLGLWMVYWTVSLFNGEVSIKENEPRGTRVILSVPRASKKCGNEKGGIRH